MLNAAVTDSPTFAPPLAPVDDTDGALVRAAGSGDVGAFEALYRRHIGRVHGVILRLVGGHAGRAEDLAQEAFVRAWQALPSYRFESAFSTWLHRLAVNTALMELRSRRSRPQASGDEDALDAIGDLDSAGHVTALSMDLERVVATLPPRAPCWCSTTWKAGSTRRSPPNSAWRSEVRKPSCTVRARCCVRALEVPHDP
jgi:RNA polymerase sigma factor (sigma-70 family)